MKTKQKVAHFLKLNGWSLDKDLYNSDSSCWTFVKPNHMVVEVWDDEMVFFDDAGDFLHSKTNLYMLIGVLAYYRQLPMGFRQ